MNFLISSCLKQRKCFAFPVRRGRPRVEAVAAMSESARPTPWLRFFCSNQRSARMPISWVRGLIWKFSSERKRLRRLSSVFVRQPTTSSMRVICETALRSSIVRALIALALPRRHQIMTSVSISIRGACGGVKLCQARILPDPTTCRQLRAVRDQ